MKIKAIPVILLASVLLMDFPAVYASQTPPTVTGGVSGINAAGFAAALAAVESAGGVLHGSKPLSLDDLLSLSVRPGDEISIRLDASMFLDRDGSPFPAGGGEGSDPVADISSSALRTGDITVRAASSRGGNTAEFTLAGGRDGARIEIAFSGSIAHIGDEFEFAVYLAHDGDRAGEACIDVAGVVETEIHDVGGDESYCDISEGDGYEASESARNVVFELGNGVTITRNVVSGRTYYGMSDTEIQDKDTAVLDKYPGISEVYRLQTSGLKAEGNTVRLEAGGSDYVYNTYGLYLGTADRALPYWTTYYLSTEKYEFLDIS